jgi:hypothetical protein
MPFSVTRNVEVHRDPAGRVYHVNHPNEPYLQARDGEGPRALADRYLRDVAPVYGWDDRLVTVEAESRATRDPGPFLEPADVKTMLGTTTVSYAEIYRGLRIWEAGMAVTLAERPLRAGATSFVLGPRASRLLRPRLIDGADFTAGDVTSAGSSAIRLQALAGGLPIGGMTYLLDPELRDPDQGEEHHHSQRHQHCCCHCDCHETHQRGRDRC